MKSTMKNPWFWACVLIIALITFKTCNKGSMGFLSCNKSDTLSHKIDTIVVTRVDSVSYRPEPIEKIVYVPKWYERIAYVDREVKVPDYRYVDLTNNDTCNAIKADYFAEYYYDETLNLSNGSVRIIDTTRLNRIAGRQVTLTTNDTAIKETTTVLKHKIIAYFGFKVFGSRTDIFRQGEINFGLKGKNDMIYTVGVGRERGSKENIYSIEAKLPIRLFNSKKK